MTQDAGQERFLRDQLVLLPSGRRAIVKAMLRDDRVAVEICEEPDPVARTVSLPRHLVRVIRRGYPMPKPVRVGVDGQVVN